MIAGEETEARMKWMHASLSIAFVREGPPLPPAPVFETRLAINSTTREWDEGKFMAVRRTGAPDNPLRLSLL